MSGNHLFVGYCNGRFRSFDRESGQIEHEYNFNESFGERSFHAALLLGDDDVLVATEIPTGSVYAFDCDSCRMLWRRPCGPGVFSDLLGAGERVFVQTNDDSVLCLDRGNGRTLWAYAAHDTSGPRRNKQLSPALAGNLLLYVDNQSTLRALRTADGTIAWERPFDATVVTSVSVWRGRAYVGTRARVLFALDPATGAVLSRLPVPGVDWPPLSCSDRGVLGWASLTDTIEGKVNWHWRLVAFDAALKRVLWTKDAPGQERIEGRGDEWNSFRPLILGRLAIVGTFQGHVLAYDLESGKQVWEFKVVGSVRSLAEDPGKPGRIYIGTGPGSLYAYDVSRVSEPERR